MTQQFSEGEVLNARPRLKISAYYDEHSGRVTNVDVEIDCDGVSAQDINSITSCLGNIGAGDNSMPVAPPLSVVPGGNGNGTWITT